MASFSLSTAAESDLLAIWRDTRDKWSEAQADKYLDQLQTVCNLIAEGELRERKMTDVHPDLRFHHSGRHYVFWLSQPTPLIIAFLHDRMDLVRLGRTTRRLIGLV